MSFFYPSLSQLCPVVAFDDKNNIFFNSDNTIGFGFMCQPLPGVSDVLQDQLKSLFSSDFPKGSIMSFCLYRSPDIDATLNSLKVLRQNAKDDILYPIVADRANFLLHHSRNHIISKSNLGMYDCGMIVDVKLVITMKIPVINGLAPTEIEIRTAKDLIERTEAALNEMYFCPTPLTAVTWLRFISTMFNFSDEASWKNSVVKWDETKPLCEQFYDFDSDLDDTDPTRSFFGIGSLDTNIDNNEFDEEKKYTTYVQVLSPKTWPSSLYLGGTRYMGDGSGEDKTIKENYAVVGQIYFSDHIKQLNFFTRKRQTTAKFAYGPLIKLQPNLGKAMNDLERYNDDISSGAKALKVSLSVIIYAPTKKRLLSASTAMQQQFEIDGFKILPDKAIQREMFFNCLPLFTEIGFLFGAESKRFLNCSSRTVISLLPIFSEWKGTGTPHIALISRTGQLMTLSLHDSQTNKNAVIAAESGSGKSFFTNELLTMYLSEGAKCWVIDIGRSYAKLCEILGGEFIVFSEERSPCLNCFELVKDYKEEQNFLLSIVQTMVAPQSVLTDQQISVLSRILDEQWAIHGNKLTVDLIEKALLSAADEADDIRIRDMATQIYAFTTRGAFGKYFNGKNNIVFNNNFTVLELEELSNRPNLRKVVLQQLIFQIQQAVYLSKDRSQKKIVMIDEGWDLLKEKQSVGFMEHAYRKFRKYNGSMIIATQSLNDLYGSSEAGVAIAENSSYYFLLRQKPETIEQIKKEKRLDLGEAGYNFLKTVHTISGVFSEIFIKSGAGNGVARLIVSDFQKLLYSTDPVDVQAINNYVNRGLSYTDAINHVLMDRNLYRSYKKDIGQNPIISQSELKDLILEKISLDDISDISLVMKVANEIIREKRKQELVNENTK